jgi:carbonic anhydrase/acetyltransferase-like protein (isoleucine patch superfamily)
MSMLEHLLTKPSIDKTAFVSKSSAIIGNVSIGAYASIWPMVVARGDMEKIIIGAKTNVQDNSVLHTTHGSDFHKSAPVIIGNNVTIGHSCVIHGCTIHDLCLIGIKTTILDHAIIEPYTLIGANSLVPEGKILTGKYLWLGSPVRKIRPLTREEINFFEYSANNYVELQKYYKQYKLDENLDFQNQTE